MSNTPPQFVFPPTDAIGTCLNEAVRYSLSDLPRVVDQGPHNSISWDHIEASLFNETPALEGADGGWATAVCDHVLYGRVEVFCGWGKFTSDGQYQLLVVLKVNGSFFNMLYQWGCRGLRTFSIQTSLVARQLFVDEGFPEEGWVWEVPLQKWYTSESISGARPKAGLKK